MKKHDTVKRLPGLMIIGALVFAELSCSKPAPPGPLGVPANDPPVKIVGGSITFRTGSTWADASGTTKGPAWKTTVQAAPAALNFKRVSLSSSVAPSSLTATYNNQWMIEVDARDAAGTGLSGNGVMVCAGTYSSGQCNIANTAPSTTITIYPIHASADVDFYNQKPDAPTWAAAQYQGLRYKDQTSPCAMPGTFCEHIGRLKVTVADGTLQTLFCPDGECHVEIGQ